MLMQFLYRTKTIGNWRGRGGGEIIYQFMKIAPQSGKGKERKRTTK